VFPSEFMPGDRAFVRVLAERAHHRGPPPRDSYPLRLLLSSRFSSRPDARE